jgi:hypothetical protein
VLNTICCVSDLRERTPGRPVGPRAERISDGDRSCGP